MSVERRILVSCSTALLLAGTALAADREVTQNSGFGIEGFDGEMPRLNINDYGRFSAPSPWVTADMQARELLDSEGVCAESAVTIWDNGDCTCEEDGQNSQDEVPGSPGFYSRVADDFFIQEGCYYWISCIKVRMAVDNKITEPVVELEFRDDCDGKPATGIEALSDDWAGSDLDGDGNRDAGTPFVDYTATNLGPSGTWPDFDIWEFCFAINQFAPDSAPGALDPSCEYKRYWLSPVGKGLGLYFWISADLADASGCTTPNNIQGKQGQFLSPAYGAFDWQDGDLCPCDAVCTDYCFEIRGLKCKELKDNRDYDTDIASPISVFPPNVQLDGALAVDDFQVPPCEDLEICKLVVWFATNCGPDQIFGNLYDNECDCPAGDPTQAPYSLGAPSEVFNLTRNKDYTGLDQAEAFAMSQSCPIATDGPGTIGDGFYALDIYRVTWKNNANLPLLEKGRNYWLNVGVVGTGDINNRGFWLFRKYDEDCDDICINEGKYRNPFWGIDEFTSISEVDGNFDGTPDFDGPRDFAFLLYTNQVTTTANPPALDIPNAGEDKPEFHLFDNASVNSVKGVIQTIR